MSPFASRSLRNKIPGKKKSSYKLLNKLSKPRTISRHKKEDEVGKFYNLSISRAASLSAHLLAAAAVRPAAHRRLGCKLVPVPSG